MGKGRLLYKSFIDMLPGMELTLSSNSLQPNIRIFIVIKIQKHKFQKKKKKPHTHKKIFHTKPNLQTI